MGSVSDFADYAQKHRIALRPAVSKEELDQFARRCSLDATDPVISFFKLCDGFASSFDRANMMRIWSTSEILNSAIFAVGGRDIFPIMDYSFCTDVICVAEGKLFSTLREQVLDFGFEEALALWVEGRIEDILIWDEPGSNLPRA